MKNLTLILFVFIAYNCFAQKPQNNFLPKDIKETKVLISDKPQDQVARKKKTKKPTAKLAQFFSRRGLVDTMRSVAPLFVKSSAFVS